MRNSYKEDLFEQQIEFELNYGREPTWEEYDEFKLNYIESAYEEAYLLRNDEALHA